MLSLRFRRRSTDPSLLLMISGTRSCDAPSYFPAKDRLTFRKLRPTYSRPAHSRRGDSMKTFSFVKASCLLFWICLALAIHAPAQTFTVLQNFPNSAPTAGLIQGLDGN